VKSCSEHILYVYSVLHCIETTLWHVMHSKGSRGMQVFFFSHLSYFIWIGFLASPVLEHGDWTNIWNMFLECCILSIQWIKPQRFKASGFLIPCQLAMLDAEDEGAAVLPKVSNCLLVKMVQHPRSLESSATLLWQPEVSGEVLLDSCSNNTSQWPGYYELGNKCVCFAKGGEFLDCLSDCWFMKEDCASWC
jgi:hypothetical protein